MGIIGYLGYQRFSSQNKQGVEDLPFDAEGPYALLFPRRDGNALVLNLKRTASYESISYELAYTSKDEGESQKEAGSIDRGVMGKIDTKQKKGEIEQEILLGTCSKNICKYDKGVENGTLTLHIKKGDKAYKMVAQWHLQKPDIALGVLTSGDDHFTYTIDADREVLAMVGFTIINDLTGIPKLPGGKEVLGKVYSLNTPIAKELRIGVVSLELAENPSGNAKLYRYDGKEWQELETKIEGNKLSAVADGAGIFAVLKSSK